MIAFTWQGCTAIIRATDGTIAGLLDAGSLAARRLLIFGQGDSAQGIASAWGCDAHRGPLPGRPVRRQSDSARAVPRGSLAERFRARGRATRKAGLNLPPFLVIFPWWQPQRARSLKSGIQRLFFSQE